MGKILIKKYQIKNTRNLEANNKWFGRIVHRETIDTLGLAEHIMKHGTVYTDDVCVGLTRKLMRCMAELLADGYKVKLDGIGTLYLAVKSSGVDAPEEFDCTKNIKKVRVAFLADQSNASLYKGKSMRSQVQFSQDLSKYGASSESGGSSESGDNNGGGNGGSTTPVTEP